MTEPGGPATQTGIRYQNTAAALYLGRLLDLRPRPVRERVIEVRIEAPTHVDDIVVTFADRHRAFIQARSSFHPTAPDAHGFWCAFARQWRDLNHADGDRVVIYAGETTTPLQDLREAAERAAASSDETEWVQRLSGRQQTLVKAIDVILPKDPESPEAYSLLGILDVEIRPVRDIERDETPRWMPDASRPPGELLALLRDYVGGEARRRGVFTAPKLLARLIDDHGVTIHEPPGWGTGAYRDAMRELAVIEIPGTGFLGAARDVFHWPKVKRFDSARRPDFDDEALWWRYSVVEGQIDLTLFPTTDLTRVVVVAGPGFGKTALLKALSNKLLDAGHLPALVTIPDLARADLDLIQFLTSKTNAHFSVAIDWRLMAETGRLVLLLDGLDEIAFDRRPVILERLRVFTARFPDVPWMLMVRDAAILGTTVAATVVEIQALDDTDIVCFIETYRADTDPALWVRRLNASADLKRLARVPLFLAMLLVTAHTAEDLPTRRADLIESYLKVLSSPEAFKAGGQPPSPLSASALRRAAEHLAFEILERDSIGTTERAALRILEPLSSTAGSAEDLIASLMQCGALRRTGAITYEFPFPIVQEYLAACDLLESRPNDISRRFPDAIKRPWAQVLQFSIEQHPNPDAIIRSALTTDDDAFYTGLRLVARCVVNGARVGAVLRRDIARQLAAAWLTAPFGLRQRVGHLIADGFADTPLEPEVRACLSRPWLLHSGAGEIVAQLNEPGLTREVLTALLNHNCEGAHHLHATQRPIDTMAREALAMYLERVRASHTTAKEQFALGSLISDLTIPDAPDVLWSEIASDESLPLIIRLRALGKVSGPLDEAGRVLLDRGLESCEEWEWRAAATILGRQTAGPSVLSEYLMRPEIPIDRRAVVIGDILQEQASDDVRVTMARTVADDCAVDSYLRDVCRLISARFGDRAAMQNLISRIETIPVGIASTAMALFGHHRDRLLVVSCVEGLERRSLELSSRADIAGGAVTGMTGIFQMDVFRAGIVKPAPAHPGFDVFGALVEDWSRAEISASHDAIRLDIAAAELGSSAALKRVAERITQALDLNTLDLFDTRIDNNLARAVRILRRGSFLFGIGFLENIVKREIPSLSVSAAEMLAAHPVREALDILIVLHARVSDWYLKSTLYGGVLRNWRVNSV